MNMICSVCKTECASRASGSLLRYVNAAVKYLSSLDSNEHRVVQG